MHLKSLTILNNRQIIEDYHDHLNTSETQSDRAVPFQLRTRSTWVVGWPQAVNPPPSLLQLQYIQRSAFYNTAPVPEQLPFHQSRDYARRFFVFAHKKAVEGHCLAGRPAPEPGSNRDKHCQRHGIWAMVRSMHRASSNNAEELLFPVLSVRSIGLTFPTSQRSELP